MPGPSRKIGSTNPRRPTDLARPGHVAEPPFHSGGLGCLELTRPGPPPGANGDISGCPGHYARRNHGFPIRRKHRPRPAIGPESEPPDPRNDNPCAQNPRSGPPGPAVAAGPGESLPPDKRPSLFDCNENRSDER